MINAEREELWAGGLDQNYIYTAESKAADCANDRKAAWGTIYSWYGIFY